MGEFYTEEQVREAIVALEIHAEDYLLNQGGAEISIENKEEKI
jgi:hypothetical protein